MSWRDATELQAGMKIRFWRANIVNIGRRNLGETTPEDTSNAHYGTVKGTDGDTVTISSDLTVVLKRCTNSNGKGFWRPIATTEKEIERSGASCGITYYKIQVWSTKGGARKTRRSTKGRQYKKK